LKKLLLPLIFSIFLISSFNVAFATPTISVQDLGLNFRVTGTDVPHEMGRVSVLNQDALGVIVTRDCQSSLPSITSPLSAKIDLPLTATAEDCNSPPDQAVVCIGRDLSITQGRCTSAVGGDIIPLDTTMVLVAGTQTIAAWMIPVLVSAIGIGIVIARKF